MRNTASYIVLRIYYLGFIIEAPWGYKNESSEFLEKIKNKMLGAIV
jgi:hypothetical protein